MEDVFKRIASEIAFRKFLLNISFEDIAKELNCSSRTVRRRMANPKTLTLEELSILFDMLRIDNQKRGELFK